MKDIVIVFLSILLGFMILLSTTLYSRGERIKYVVNYDINREHLLMQEINDYSYCPYCGEYIGTESEE